MERGVKLPDLEVRGLDEKYKPAWYRFPFWTAIGKALRLRREDRVSYRDRQATLYPCECGRRHFALNLRECRLKRFYKRMKNSTDKLRKELKAARARRKALGIPE